MKIVFLTGSHPRHAHLARAISEAGELVGLVIENREAFVPEPPESLKGKNKELFIKHFAGREDAEAKFFGNAKLPNVTCRFVELEELNQKSTADFVNSLTPDLIFSYGVHKLTFETLDAIRAPLKWNIHGGLSPWYRGVITHFWPSFFLEPQCTGMTVHELTKDIDGGSIVHQTVAELVRGDGVHELSCRAVLSLCKDMKPLLEKVASSEFAGAKKQKTSGRIWRSSDWRPEHLQVVYDLYENQVVDRYLDGDFYQFTPKLIRQF